MKPTNINIGKLFNLDRRTIANYKKTNFRLYNALLIYFNNVHNEEIDVEVELTHKSKPNTEPELLDSPLH